MGLIDTLKAWAGGAVRQARPETGLLPNETPAITSETGHRATPENGIKYLYRLMWVDADVRQAILDIREMDRLDPRVKRVHARVSRDAIKGGLILQQAASNETLAREWDAYQRRLQLNRVEKLKSDARGLVMEGSLPLQWVLDDAFRVVAAVRMPAETIFPNVDASGRFKAVAEAYFQLDVMSGAKLAGFPLWQLFLSRFDPDNFDDMGAMGRPFLDAARTTWRKLTMTEEDLVIRRRTRAPLRMAHVLEGANKEDLEAYRATVERGQHEITTDFYLNKKGNVSAVQGDSNLDQVADVVHLLDTFFAGSPLPKGLAGYTDGLARDILEDLKRDYYEEVDSLQDTLSFGYEQGFRLHLLLKNINPDAEDFTIRFAERMTETANQTADRALKLRALGLPYGLVWEEMGYDPAYVRERIKGETSETDPYPDPGAIQPRGRPAPRVSVTPGNARKGESGTSISNG
jgi:hypothetical protein